MMEAVKAGMGREEAHSIIKKHAVATVDDLRTSKVTTNNLLERLANDEQIPLTEEQLHKIEKEGKGNVGMAHEQIFSFIEKVHQKLVTCPEALQLKAESIL